MGRGLLEELDSPGVERAGRGKPEVRAGTSRSTREARPVQPLRRGLGGELRKGPREILLCGSSPSTTGGPGHCGSSGRSGEKSWTMAPDTSASLCPYIQHCFPSTLQISPQSLVRPALDPHQARGGLRGRAPSSQHDRVPAGSPRGEDGKRPCATAAMPSYCA